MRNGTVTPSASASRSSASASGSRRSFSYRDDATLETAAGKPLLHLGRQRLRPGDRRGLLRVAVLKGPRQAGKTTLAKQLVAAVGGSFVTLDDRHSSRRARRETSASNSIFRGPYEAG